MTTTTLALAGIGHNGAASETAQTGSLPRRPAATRTEPAKTRDRNNDALLLRRIGQGDRDAFRQLFEELQRPLFCYLLKLLRERETTEEVLNETMLEVWRQAARFEGRSRATTWIFSIAHNLAVSRLRKRRELALDEEQAMEIEDQSPRADTRLENRDVSRLLERLLDRLSAEHREVLHLAYWQEFSILQIAEMLSVPPSTVKTRMFYARVRLKTLLKRHGIEGALP
jgi:RNA polymerase sigma-70 factor (ECF subfamily)